MPWHPVTNPFEPVRVLTDDQVEQIHDASLTLLATTGMRMLDAGARQRFAAAGCEVDEIMVRFDPELIVETISLAPSQFTLRARNPERDLVIGGSNVVFGSVGGPAFATTSTAGAARAALAEQSDYLRLIQSSTSSTKRVGDRSRRWTWHPRPATSMSATA